MRYMNLACLLMTLLCLLTILMLSGGNGSSSSSSSSNGNDAMKTLQEKSAVRKSHLFTGDATDGTTNGNAAPADNFDSLDSLPTASAQQVASSGGANDNQLFDDFTPFSAAKFRRKSELSNADSPAKTTNSIDREVEETTATTTAAQQEDLLEQRPSRGHLFSSSGNSEASPGSLIDLLLGQLFSNDMELGPLYKAIRRAANSSSGSGIGGGSATGNLLTMSPPVIRRSKNGATIIISSSSGRFGSNDSSPSSSSLFDRLLPPIFRPISFAGTSNTKQVADNASSALPTSGIATITIGAEPIFASSSTGGLGRLMSPFAALDPFSGPAGNPSPSTGSRGATGGLFMEPLGFRSPFGGPMFSAPPMAFPPPALLSMMMRASSAQPLDDQEVVGIKAEVLPSNKSSLSDKTNDTLTTQASQQQNTNSTTNSTTATLQQIKSNTGNLLIDPDVETFDLTRPPVHHNNQQQQQRMHNLYPRTRPSGSMLVFSSSSPVGDNLRDAAFPFPGALSPFIGLPAPQMMLISGGGNGNGNGNGNGPTGNQHEQPALNPILKSILSNVMSDVAAAATGNSSPADNRTGSGRLTPLRSSSNNVPHWSSLSSDFESSGDSDWPPSASQPAAADVLERWDEQSQQVSKHLRARHREAADDMDSPMDSNNGDFVTGLQLDNQPPSGSSAASSMPFSSILDPTSSSGSLVSGTIRQTIRGPGMSVERIIELPSSRVQRVAAGVRSQSLSRSDVDLDSESSASAAAQRPTLISSTGPFFMPRLSTGGDDFAAGSMPLGFISRLLSDIGGANHRRSESSFDSSSSSNNNNQRRQMQREQQIMKSRLLSASEDDLDEGDFSQQQVSNRHHQQQDNSWPKMRFVGGVRVRTHRPIGIGSASEPIFMPSNHFSSQSEDDNREATGNNLLGEATGGKLGASFEDTMNSMEDRINHVLSVASQQTSGPFNNHKVSASDEQQLSEQQLSVKPAGIVAVQRNHQAPVLSSLPVVSSTAIVDASKQPLAAVGGQQTVDAKHSQSANPFTSPSSPLFGFPASSMAMSSSSSNVDAPASGKSKVQVNNNLPVNLSSTAVATGNNRQQRSFTYHSNNEVASNNNNNKRLEVQPTISEPIARSRFIPLQSPPTGVIMGRRLDDGPIHESSPINTNQQQQQQHIAQVVPASFEERNKLFGEARGFTSSASVTGGGDSFRTIVV